MNEEVEVGWVERPGVFPVERPLKTEAVVLYRSVLIMSRRVVRPFARVEPLILVLVSMSVGVLTLVKIAIFVLPVNGLLGALVT